MELRKVSKDGMYAVVVEKSPLHNGTVYMAKVLEICEGGIAYDGTVIEYHENVVKITGVSYKSAETAMLNSIRVARRICLCAEF
jgi:hypothetical protein